MNLSDADKVDAVVEKTSLQGNVGQSAVDSQGTQFRTLIRCKTCNMYRYIKCPYISV